MLIKSFIHHSSAELQTHEVITVCKEAHTKGKPQVTTGSYTEAKNKSTSQSTVLPQSNTTYMKVLLTDP